VIPNDKKELDDDSFQEQELPQEVADDDGMPPVEPEQDKDSAKEATQKKE
jgi:hypothetical protein